MHVKGFGVADIVRTPDAVDELTPPPCASPSMAVSLYESPAATILKFSESTRTLLQLRNR